MEINIERVIISGSVDLALTGRFGEMLPEILNTSKELNGN